MSGVRACFGVKVDGTAMRCRPPLVSVKDDARVGI